MLALRLLSHLEKTLKQTATVSKKDEICFWCPICKLEQYKKKLIINLDKDSNKFGKWHCWNCQISHSTAGNNIYSLYKKLNLKYDNNELDNLLSSINKKIEIKTDIISNSSIKLPKEFISMAKKNNSHEFNIAMNYLYSRNITLNDIIRYDIGYCEFGEYSGKIIIPSYDENFNLNYFVSRSYYDVKKTYKNPEISKNTIIFFEHLINWKYPIILVEGVFDAIAVSMNAIPILGKNISEQLYKKIILNKVKCIYICLDEDALQTSIKYIEKFTNQGIKVFFIKIQDKDPSKIGRLKFREYLSNAIEMDFKNLIMLKMENIL